MDMNLGLLSKLGFIERRGDVVLEGPLLDLLMDTDLLKERIINGALADVFKRAPLAVARRRPVAAVAADAAPDVAADAANDAEPPAEVPAETPAADSTDHQG